MYERLLRTTPFAAFLIVAACGEAETKEDVRWGLRTQGVALSVKTDQQEYQLGAYIQLAILVKNFGDKSTELLSVNGTARTYRVELFDDDGNSVGKTPEGMAVDNGDIASGDSVIVSRSWRKLEPGEVAPSTFTLNRYVDIKKPGTYYLVIMRRLLSWDKGFLVSNMVKIHVVEAKPKKASE